LSALANLVTKPVATTSGLCFAGAFLSIFTVTEYIHRRRRGTEHHEHIEQFNRATVQEVTKEALGLHRPYCKLVAIRSPHNLFMLDKALADTDPQTTDVVVMTAKVEPQGADLPTRLQLDTYDQQLLTAVVNHGEKLGKSVTPLLVPTNNALHAVLNTAKELPAQEVLVGASNKYTPSYNILKFAATAARRHHSIRSCMLDAGALSLVVAAFISTGFLASSLFNFMRESDKVTKSKPKHPHINAHTHTPIPSDVILDEAATLSTLIHDPSFRNHWDGRHFNHRRHLCSLLVDSLLGNDWAKDDKYRWTRAVFRKILA